MSYQFVPRPVLKAQYFYPVGRNNDIFIGTPTKVTAPVQPEQLRMIIEEGTWIVYIVDAEGRLYMQPPESFDPKILNAPLMKTVPLPAVDFQRLITPPPSPPSSTTTQRAPAHQSGYSPVLNTYTGKESPRWAEDRHQRSSASYHPQQQQAQYRSAVPTMQYPQPMQWAAAPTQEDQYLHVRPSSSYPSTTSANMSQQHGHRRTHSSQSAKRVHFVDE